MPTVYVNDIPVELGTRKLNGVQAAELAGVLVPHYCYHPALSVVASCRMCLVEMGTLKDGKVSMQPKVLPACQTPVKDGDVVVTGDYAKTKGSSPLAYDPAYKPGERAKKAQADTLEGLLLNHPLDCPVCDKAGECKLQDYSFEFGRSESRLLDEKNRPANKPDLGSSITLFTDRCILCTRCVRFTREISGTAELQVVGRAHHEEIDVFPGRPLENKLAGNVVDLCPVGALGSKDFLYTQRVWYLKTTPGVCPTCSTGCGTHVDTNKDVVYRLRGRENPDAQGYFLCDEGRYGFHFQTADHRLRRPLVKQAAVPMADAVKAARKGIEDAAYLKAKATVVVLSPFLSVEEVFLYATYFKGLASSVRLALGPVPVVGEDDHYPKDVKGNAVSPAKFTIRAEKCPNRKGVEAVLRLFQGEVVPFDTVKGEVFAGVWFAGGYPDPKWLPTDVTAEFLVVQDLFPSVLSAKAVVVLPATAAYEKDGTFVNHAGLAQTFPRSCRPPGEVQGEAQIACDLLGRKGLVQMKDVRKELAAKIPLFSGLVEPTPTGKRLELTTV
jgi:NADH-quinone oxidoreductase subunit G